MKTYNTIPNLLEQVPHQVLTQLRSEGKITDKSYGQGEIIHFDGDVCLGLEIILSGKVSVERIDASGNLMVIAVFGTGNVLGSSLSFSKNPHYPMMVTAQEKTRLMEIRKEVLFDLCSSYPKFLRAYLEYISDNALLLGDKIKHYVNRTIRESLVNYLKHMSGIQGNTLTIRLDISKKALAERIGVQRTSISRELQKMKQEGLIDYDAHTITIIDQSILK